ncbi:RloB family protein [Actinomyces mediterranea]|uniref:RloB family protein n=1 Tax=Actinomyces mediterranea TaxID=1871028 RepID=UPI00097131F6
MARAGGRRLRRTPKTSILIVTNGERTESSYLRRLKPEARLRDDLAITIKTIHGDPKTVLSKLTSPHGDTSAYDEVWIVVDEDGADRSGFVAEYRRRSRKGRWFAVVSRPCFEVWLIAHYEQVRNYQDQNDAQEHFRKLAPVRETDKHLPSDFPFEKHQFADRHCQLPGTSRVGAGELPPSPGTGMRHLVDRLLSSRE